MHLTPFASDTSGYACKTWIAFLVDREIGRGYFVWLAPELNPIANHDASNPLSIYSRIDRAVKESRWDNKVSDVRANLLLAVTFTLGDRDPTTAARIKWGITNAPLDRYRPQCWRIHIPRDRWLKKGDPDCEEYIVESLRPGEFDVIVP